MINEFWFHKVKLPQTDAQDWQRVTIMWQLLRKKKRKKDLWCTITFFFWNASLKINISFLSQLLPVLKRKILIRPRECFTRLYISRARRETSSVIVSVVHGRKNKPTMINNCLCTVQKENLDDGYETVLHTQTTEAISAVSNETSLSTLKLITWRNL